MKRLRRPVSSRKSSERSMRIQSIASVAPSCRAGAAPSARGAVPSDISPPKGRFCGACVPGPDGRETQTAGASAQVAGGPGARDEQLSVGAGGGDELDAERRAARSGARGGGGRGGAPPRPPAGQERGAPPAPRRRPGAPPPPPPP